MRITRLFLRARDTWFLVVRIARCFLIARDSGDLRREVNACISTSVQRLFFLVVRATTGGYYAVIIGAREIVGELECRFVCLWWYVLLFL